VARPNIAVVIMSASAKPNLSALLEGRPAGTWVVLNPQMSKVLGAARTPEGAIRKAHVKPATSPRVGRRPVVLQVPDPSMVCFF
jgi:hypothetical protein